MTIEYTKEETAALLAKLTTPFTLREIKWRVVSKSKDSKKGMVAAYADPRVYALRLNDVLTPLGWSCEYATTTMNGITRQRNGSTIQSGKITVVATVDINGVTHKASTGECWADDENGMTRAEAQAFKRACSLFGLGKYLYDLKDFYDRVDVKAYPDYNHWVPLNDYGQPTRLPKLPSWAMPAHPATLASQEQKPASPAPAPQASAPAAATQAPTSSKGLQGAQNAANITVIPPNAEAELKAAKPQLLADLGTPLYNNILTKVDSLVESGSLKGNKYSFALRKLGNAADLLRALRQESETSQGSARLYQLGIDLSVIETHERLMEVAHTAGLSNAA